MTIVARWEWRTFGDGFGAADEHFDTLRPERVQESEDLYFLGRDSDASVKVRGGLMDIKRLERVNDDGLEQWVPVMKDSFPLPMSAVVFVLETLNTAMPGFRGEDYTLDGLVAAVAKADPPVHVVPVHKRREHFTIGGCMAERAQMRTAAGVTRTIAIELDDPAKVIAVVRELGQGSRRNVSVARGLKTLVGFGARRYAVIDVGTNSVKFHIGERRADGEWTRVVDRAEVTRLGEGLEEEGRLGAAPIARSVEAVAGMVEEARAAGVEAIAAVGTAGLRIAPNAVEFIAAVRERCGVDVEVIPGEEERRLAFVAATAGLDDASGSLVVFDTGGGSSQFTFSDGERFSVNVGAARFTERFGLDGPVSTDTLDEALAAIAADLTRLEGHGTPGAIIGMGGANTNLAAVSHGLTEYDPEVVQGTVLTRAEIDRQIELYRTHSADERREIAGLQPNRAEVILAGACIVRSVLTLLGRDELTVSDRGLRHGLLAERFGS